VNVRGAIVCAAAILGAAFSVFAGTPEALPSRVTPVVLAARKAGPAVVNIATEQAVTANPTWDVPGLPFDDLFDFPARTPVRRTGVGSGAVIAETGYIVTNAHVVEAATSIRVSLADGTQRQARLVSSDQSSDLAVIKIDPPAPLPFIEMGTAEDLMPGETVVALGNPFGYGHTVTSGVVSAVKRDLIIRNRTVYRDLIQTDAAINPGSSGGPLVNVHGQLIGINTAVRTEAQNIGFAIPVDRVRQGVLDLLDFRVLNHTWLGTTPAETRHAGPPVTYTVRLEAIEPKGPALAAGLAAGDVLLALDGRPVRGLIDYRARLLEKRVGDTVRFTVRRGDETKTLAVALAEAPRTPAPQLIRDRLGLVVQELTPDLVEHLDLAVSRGLLIGETVRRGPAAGAGLRTGDVIFQAATYRIDRIDELGAVLERLPKGRPLRIGVVRSRFMIWFTVNAN
jgi:serine protease Do